MDYRVLGYVLGRLVFAESITLFLPFCLAFLYGDDSLTAIACSLCISMAIGYLLYREGKTKTQELTMREGIAITGLGWLFATGIGMLPYFLGGYLSPVDAWFESLSGLTGAGATVVQDLDQLPTSILFWRMMSHWFGGLGIIVIFIALLPQTGQSSVYMYQAESSQAVDGRVLPRLHDMTRILFKMYLLFTVLTSVAFLLGGLPPMEACMHAMSTVGTGGFSTYNDNAMHFNDVPLECAAVFFMLLCGGNFGLYYRAYKKGFRVLRENTEFKTYLGIVCAATACITANLVLQMGLNPVQALRYALFQVVSILTTTGFCSTDFDTWPGFSKLVLLLLMLCGGCAGSTSGGLKVWRVALLVKNIGRIVYQKIDRRRIVTVHMNGRPVSSSALHRVGEFFFLYLFCILACTFFLTADGIGIFDALSIAASEMGDVGPAFGIAGATQTLAGLSDFSKLMVSFVMLLGRLEIFTLLVMLRPSFWSKKNRW